MMILQQKLDQLTKKEDAALSTPLGRKRPAPSPVSAPRSSEVAQSDDDDSVDDEGPGNEGEGGEVPPETCLSQAAKLNRLRRLCEKNQQVSVGFQMQSMNSI